LLKTLHLPDLLDKERSGNRAPTLHIKGIMSKSKNFPYEETVRQGTAKIVVEALSTSDAAARMGPLMDTAIGFVAGLIDGMTKKGPPPRPIACKKGCAFCCINTEIHVSPLEVLGIVRHVAVTFGEKDMRNLLEAVMADREQPGSPCPLLKDKKCSVYGGRPLACRGLNSYSATSCELNMKFGVAEATIKGWAHPWKIAAAARDGIGHGAEELDLDGRALNLRQALKIAFAAEDVAGKWLQGEPVFENAVVGHPYDAFEEEAEDA